MVALTSGGGAAVAFPEPELGGGGAAGGVAGGRPRFLAGTDAANLLEPPPQPHSQSGNVTAAMAANL